jgi:hypothetical protein
MAASVRRRTRVQDHAGESRFEVRESGSFGAGGRYGQGAHVLVTDGGTSSRYRTAKSGVCATSEASVS